MIKIVHFCAIAAVISLSSTANAQSMPRDMGSLLQKKYEIEQQRADAETTRAEAERNRAETEMRGIEQRRRVRPRNAASYTLRAGDPLAGTDAITYRLPNGVIMRFSGYVRPGTGWTCIAFCG